MLQDVRYGVRALVHARTFTLTVLVTLALGIGANTAVFSIVDSMFLRSLPVPDPGRLMILTCTRGDGTFRFPFSYPNFLEHAKDGTAFTGLAAVAGGHESLELDAFGRQERVDVLRVSDQYFNVLGLRPVAGRTFGAGDAKPGTTPAAVISERLWKRRFGGDPAFLGRSFRLGGVDFRAIGVVRETFTLDNVDEPSLAVWIPVQPDLPLGAPQWFFTSADLNWLTVVGRLRPGVDRRRAEAAVELVSRRLGRENPTVNEGVHVRVLSSLEWRMDRSPVRYYAILFGFVTGVLLMACANVTNLLLARASVRAREITLRLALGASRARVVRQLLTESLLLALAGGAAGGLVGDWILVGFSRWTFGAERLFPETIRLDARVLVFTFGLSALVGVAFGLAPALHATRGDLAGVLKTGGWSLSGREGRLSLKRTLVVAQVALSLVLLVGTGLFARALAEAWRVDLGYRTDHLLWVPLGGVENLLGDVIRQDKPDPQALADAAARGQAFYVETMEGVRKLPGVDDVGLGPAPLSGAAWTNVIVDGVKEQTVTRFTLAGPHGLRTLGIPLVAGRDFDESDLAGMARPSIVNEAMKRRFWPDRDALGLRFRPWPNAETVVFEVVGVAKDVKPGPWEEAVPLFYQCAKGWDIGANLLVRSRRDAAELGETIRRDIRRRQPRVDPGPAQTFDDVMDDRLAGFRYRTAIFAALSLLGLALAAVGLYGLVSYRVSVATRELGVRAALGATPGRLVAMVLTDAVRVVAAGIVLGLLLAVPGASVLQASVILGTTVDPLTFTAMPVLLATVGLAAAGLAARRAARISPTEALSAE